MTPNYDIRLCTTFEEYTSCLRMQQLVWQFSDIDVTPLRSFVITRRSGGMTLGAFDSSEGGAGNLLGFAHALAAFDSGNRPYYYSHMLAVDPALQNAGIGRRLKLAQRDYALAHGIGLIGWTFDPLQSRNAYLNIVKLGGVVRKYYVNYYGNASTSALHRGLDTDRLFVEWWVGAERVNRALHGEARNDAPVAAVEVPREIEQIKARDPAEAVRWQQSVRSGFDRHLSAGLYCAGFEPGRGDEPSRYLFYNDAYEEGILRYE
ncbi:MAG: GNAT family N-acetyltransferase [Acidobacteria bacterium]|nr:GNAT family N-acetyltransferase [Acidobacteriota bacterium]MCW5970379.1 GNAT family N-acetyltransferase [Blastocatellales bacterium]